jgi:hypothetical protein
MVGSISNCAKVKFFIKNYILAHCERLFFIADGG